VVRMRNGDRVAGSPGFTLIELLVVIIIIAVLASIAIPTFLGARSKGQDAAAVTLVRNALTTVEGLYADSQDYSAITALELAAAEPSVTWRVSAVDLVAPASDPAITGAVAAQAGANEVDFFGQAPHVFDIACVSASGNRYGIEVVATGMVQTAYVKVKVVDGSSSLGW
jgi:type IV pilus assembly protein PilA